MCVISLNNLINVYVCLKDGMCSTYKLGQFGVGEDSVVGVNFQTDPQDYWRGGLQGLAHTHPKQKFPF